MGEEFKDFEVEAPVLTLEPDLTEEKEEIAKKEPEKPQEPAVEEPVLSPQEQKIVEDFAAKIDIENTNQILQYGAGTQKKMADFSAISSWALAHMRTSEDLMLITRLSYPISSMMCTLSRALSTSPSAVTP